MSPDAGRLLALCARPQVPEALRPELAARVAAVSDWEDALRAAELHGLSPLLYRHAREAAVRLPSHAEHQLQGLYLRHRRANAVRLGALAEILETFEAHAVDVRVLKGPALMSLVYGEPALRPTADLDLLVPEADAAGAQALLGTLGYTAPAGSLERHHHLPAATRDVDGVLVQVEVHHNALVADYRHETLRLDSSREVPQTIEVAGRRALALGRHELLWHLCQHLVGPLPVPLRLLGIADIVGYAEAFESGLDWQRLRRLHPIVLRVLGFANAVTPLAEAVAAHLPDADVRAASADDVSAALAWSPDGGVRAGGRMTQATRTAHAPAWWLALRYGGRTWPGLTAARLRHLLVVGRALRRRTFLESS